MADMGLVDRVGGLHDDWLAEQCGVTARGFYVNGLPLLAGRARRDARQRHGVPATAFCPCLRHKEGGREGKGGGNEERSH